MQHVASYGGQPAGIPCDIPILLMSYRRDVLEELGLAVPRTVASLAVDSFSIELGKLLAGQQGVRATLDAMARDAGDAARGVWPAR